MADPAVMPARLGLRVTVLLLERLEQMQAGDLAAQAQLEAVAALLEPQVRA